MFKLRYYLLQFLRSFFSLFFNAEILSQKELTQYIGQRDKAVSILARHENESLIPGLTGVVVSKDRAIQLFALLESYQLRVSNKAPLVVIYSCSSEKHESSYLEVIQAFKTINPQIRFVKEVEFFPITLASVLKHINTRNIFFLVDDIVFISDFDMEYATNIDTQKYVLSLRHSPYIVKSYTSNMTFSAPSFKEVINNQDLLEFSWFEEKCEWSDPWSLDGHVLSTAELRVLAEISNFSLPNSFEAALKSYSSLCSARKGLCYKQSKIVNLPVNRVQNEILNRSGDVSSAFFLEKWETDMIIDIKPFQNLIPKSTHEIHEFTFIKRSSHCIGAS